MSKLRIVPSSRPLASFAAAATALLTLWGCVAGGNGSDGTVDGGVDPVDQDGTWSLVLEGLEGALISVAGRSADDVWLAGANTQDGDGALVLHFDGERFTRERTGEETHLWWVHVVGDVQFFGGEDGVILRHDGDGFERQETPSDGTVFGIWGLAEDDLWAVGGPIDGPPGFVWRYDGERWRDVSDELPETDGPRPQIFKVFGHSTEDIMFVGNDGLCFHYDGSEFALVDSGTERRLFTVHGHPSGDPRYVAVGGFGSAVLIEGDARSFSDGLPADEEALQLFGVRMTSATEGYSVGLDGLVMRRDAEGWHSEDTGVDLTYPFHAVWVDPEGGVWAVGGDVLTPFLDQGMLLHRGTEIPNEITY